MVCRTTDEYRAMAQAGCLAVGEPAFWAGYDRSSADGFRDYFVQLTECEPARAAKFGMDHYTWHQSQGGAGRGFRAGCDETDSGVH